MPLPRLVPPLSALLIALVLGSCAPEASRGQLMYRVTALDGSAPTEADMVAARGRLEVRLLGAGYERNDVSVLPPDRLRVVLPESVVGELPSIRALLEEPEDLPVRIHALGD